MGRFQYAPPTVRDFQLLFGGQSLARKGGALSDINVYRPESFYKRGGGILSILGGIGRTVLPFLRKFLLPVAGTMVSQVADDVSSGRSKLKGSLKTRGIDALKNLGSRVMAGGKKVKAKIVKKKKKRLTGRQHKRDVFSLL